MCQLDHSHQPEIPWQDDVLPYLTGDCAGIGGTLRHDAEDFEVEEIPAYEPSGEGEHLFLWIEKQDTSTEYLTRHLSRVLNVRSGDIGVAGLKDRRAVTRQYISVPASCEPHVAEIATEEIKVLRCARHGNKLRTGHLKGNRFSILVRDVHHEAAERATRIVEQIQELGFPNYYGQQRFGINNETLRTGFDLLRGRKKSRDLRGSNWRWLLRLSLSAAQSFLFNRALSERLSEGLLHQVLQGDVMQVVESGGCFVAEDVDAEQTRFHAKDTVVTGPMFGPKMKQPTSLVAERESRLLDAAKLNPSDFRRYRKFTTGTRRAYLIWPEGFSMEDDSRGLRFRFTLPSGVYATTLLREFMKNDGDE